MNTPGKARSIIIAGLAILIMACASDGSSSGSQASSPDQLAKEQPTLMATQAPAPTTIPPATEVPTPTPTPVPVPLARNFGEQGGSLPVAGFADVPHRDVHQTVQETLASLGPGLAYSRLLRLQPGPGNDQPNLLLE